MDPDGEGIVIDEPGTVVGVKQMYSKIALDLSAIDEPCAQRVIDMWKADVAAIMGLKNHRPYTSLEEYVPFRVRDVASRSVTSFVHRGSNHRANNHQTHPGSDAFRSWRDSD